jgi:hypothetical protein
MKFDHFGQLVRCRPVPRRSSHDANTVDALGQYDSPMVLTGMVNLWPAFRDWTFAGLAERFGTQQVTVSDRLLRPNRSLSLPLAKFLQYCTQSASRELLPSLCCGLQLFEAHPELLEAFEVPHALAGIYGELSGDLKLWYAQNFGVLLVGSRGAVTPLHVDLFFTDAWLAQIAGRKDCLLVPPAEGKEMELDTLDLLDERCDSTFLAQLNPYRTVLEPGELLLIPAGWYHQVLTMSPSISLSFNFVTANKALDHILGISSNMTTWNKRVQQPRFVAGMQAR